MRFETRRRNEPYPLAIEDGDHCHRKGVLLHDVTLHGIVLKQMFPSLSRGFHSNNIKSIPEKAFVGNPSLITM